MSPSAHFAAVAALATAAVFVACSSDDDRPAAASPEGTVVGSSGGGSSGGSQDGSAPPADAGSSSGSSGADAGTDSGLIETGYRATIDGVAAVFDTAPTGLRQNSGASIELSGKDAAGNELRVTMTVASGTVAPGTYECGAGAAFGSVTYIASGGDTWSATATGDCTVIVNAIDNQANGLAVGTFGATAKQDGGPNKLVTNGEFSLQLD